MRHAGIAVARPANTPSGYAVVTTACVTTEASAKKRGLYVADDNIRCCQEAAQAVLQVLRAHDVGAVAVEVPSSGAKSASALRALSLATGMISVISLVSEAPFVWVRPVESKRLFTGSKVATKKEMMARALELYGDDAWRGMSEARGSDKPAEGLFEHVADAWAALNAARETNEYKMVLMMNGVADEQ